MIGTVELIIVILLALIIVWMAVLSFSFYTALRHYKSLKIEDGDNIYQIVNRIYTLQSVLNSKLEMVLKVLGEMKVESYKHVQKVALKRFNPFGDTGGNQSFSLALLDRKGDGIILSSLHGRSGTRIYAKPVENGKHLAYELSEEEVAVIKLALEDNN